MVREKEIPGHGDYSIRDDGTILTPRLKETRGRLDKHGYYLLNNLRVHRLVATAFCENPRPDIFDRVDHINHDRADNRAVNLRWVNHRLNMLNRSDAAGKVVKEPNPERREDWMVDEYRKMRKGRPLLMGHKWRKAPYYVEFPGRGGSFETEEEANAYLARCRKERWDEAYAGYLASEPRFKERGVQTEETRLVGENK